MSKVTIDRKRIKNLELQISHMKKQMTTLMVKRTLTRKDLRAHWGISAYKARKLEESGVLNNINPSGQPMYLAQEVIDANVPMLLDRL